MSYARLRARKAFEQTNQFWNLHRVWTLCVPAVIGLATTFKSVWSQTVSADSSSIAFHAIAPAALYGLLLAGATYVVGWVGSFLINYIWLAPTALYEEQRKAMMALSGPRLTLRIEGGMFQRSPITNRGQRGGRLVEEYVGIVTLVITVVNTDRPTSINRWDLVMHTAKWGIQRGIPIHESQRLNRPMFHDLPLNRVKFDAPYRLKDVSEVESNVPLDTGIGATRFIRFVAEVWDDEAYSTTKLQLTAFDSFGGECQATISASELKRIPVDLED